MRSSRRPAASRHTRNPTTSEVGSSAQEMEAAEPELRTRGPPDRAAVGFAAWIGIPDIDQNVELGGPML